MSSLLGNNVTKGLIFIVSAPAGTGKTTLIEMLVKEFPQIVASISFTTRKPREGEIDGIHYHFISEKEFKAKISSSDFLEYVKLYGTYYGTSKQWVREQQNLGKHVVLVIDTQGAQEIKKEFAAFTVFIRPPSLEILKDRLMNRQTESLQVVEKRLEWAKVELEAAKEYDYHVINDNLNTAFEVLKSIVIAECHRNRQNI
ncbi:MAG: guanylate kinase [Parachlamydiaceae bacterium]|nr:guanylate kinase [Parachlamydiaceae bacterium]